MMALNKFYGNVYSHFPDKEGIDSFENVQTNKLCIMKSLWKTNETTQKIKYSYFKYCLF